MRLSLDTLGFFEYEWCQVFAPDYLRRERTMEAALCPSLRSLDREIATEWFRALQAMRQAKYDNSAGSAYFVFGYNQKSSYEVVSVQFEPTGSHVMLPEGPVFNLRHLTVLRPSLYGVGEPGTQRWWRAVLATPRSAFLPQLGATRFIGLDNVSSVDLAFKKKLHLGVKRISCA
ncbi:MAG TPA: hypothetical protein VFZ48_01050 [Candidatus Saccharimonadales bacterium]